RKPYSTSLLLLGEIEGAWEVFFRVSRLEGALLVLANPTHPPRHLVLPPQVNPWILTRQEQPDAHVINASGLQRRDRVPSLIQPQ
ncbi:MAG: hypothetical protein ACK55I_34490, partial [bacterium]